MSIITVYNDDIMANNKSNYLENKVLDHALGTTTFTKPTSVYVALFTSDPTEAGSGTEVSGGSYARQVATFAASSGGSTSNSADLTYTSMPTATVSHVGIYDALTAGNLLYYGPANASQPVSAGNTLTIPAGSLIVSEL